MLVPRLARYLAIPLAIAMLTLATVGSALAGAESSGYRNCSPDGDNTICFTVHDVTQQHETRSGLSHTRESGSMLIEYFDAEGELLWSDKTRWHTNQVQRAGEALPQVYHDQVKVTFEGDGETCTATMNVTFANGEVRHLGPEWEWDCK